MIENIWRLSPSLLSVMQRSKAGKQQISIIDNIFEFISAENDISDVKTIDLHHFLAEKGVAVSYSTVKNYYRMIKNLLDFLADQDPEKVQKYQKIINGAKGPYFQFIHSGVKLFIKDKIYQLDNPKEITERSDADERGQLLNIPEEYNLDDSEEDRFGDLTKNLEAMSKSYVAALCDIIAELKTIHKEAESELGQYIKYFRELEACRKQIAELIEQIRALEHENRHLSVQLENFENKVMDLTAENIALCEQNGKLKSQISEMSKDDLVSRLLKKLDEVELVNKAPQLNAADALASDLPVHQKKNVSDKNGIILPKIYLPTGGKVEYYEFFLKKFEEMRHFNPKAAKRIGKIIAKICEKGIEAISGIKTISAKSQHTPNNSLQIAVSKHRVTMQKKNHGLIFYEVFPRKESPFMTKSN